MDPSQPHTVPAEIQASLEALCNAAEEMDIMISFWIDFRKKCLENFQSTPESVRFLQRRCFMDSNDFPTSTGLSGIWLTAVNGIRSGLRFVFPAVACILSLGIYSGFNEGIQQFNDRRLNMAVSRLSRDKPETIAIEESVKTFMECLSSFSHNLEKYIYVQRGVASEQLMRQINPKFRLLLIGSGPKPFREWSEKVNGLLQYFLEVLRLSMEPFRQYLSTLKQNSGHEPDMEIDTLVGRLDQAIKAIQLTRLGAQKYASGVNEVMSKISSATSEVPSGEREMDVSKIEDDFDKRCQPYENTTTARGIDRFFEQIRELFQESITVADDVRRIINESGLSHCLRQKSKPIEVKKVDDSKNEHLSEEEFEMI